MTEHQRRPLHSCGCAVCRAGTDIAVQEHHRQINLLLQGLNEPQRRWYVGSLSQQTDGPTDEQLSRMTGLDEKTIRRGRRELQAGLPATQVRQRRPGGGRPRREKKTQP